MLALPPPSPCLSLILCSLEAINKTLKGHQSTNVEVEPPPSRVGNPKVVRESEGGPPPGDIKPLITSDTNPFSIRVFDLYYHWLINYNFIVIQIQIVIKVP
jgi:hypothetical protein